MKKFVFILSLMAISFLTNCGCSAKTYHVKFTDNGELVEEKDYKANEVIIAPKDPAPYEKDHKTYTFEAWYEGDFKFETGLKANKDYNFEAKFNYADTKYIVTFMNEGKEYKKVTDAIFGDEIIAPETNPEHSIDKKYNYTFNTWYYEGSKIEFKTGDKVEGNTIIVADYNKAPIPYSATFNYADGTTESVKKIFSADDLTIMAPETKRTPQDEEHYYAWKSGNLIIGSGESKTFTVNELDNYVFNESELEKEYTITYVLGDDKAVNPETNPKTYKFKDSVALSAPSLEGFTFKGWFLDKIESNKFQYQNGWESEQMTGDITLYADWHVTDKTLNDYSWPKINDISNRGEASKYFDIGDTKTVNIYNIDHKVRIIGYDHDQLSSSTMDEAQYAGITFEFANLITDSSGAVVSSWNSKDPKTNYNFPDSSFNDFLNKNSDCILNKLPDELKKDGIIKEVKKSVATTSEYTVSPYNTKLFPLSYREITASGSDQQQKEEGAAYTFYTGSGDTETNRIKRIVDLPMGPTPYCLRSPYIKNDSNDYAWCCLVGGNLINKVVSDKDYGVAPAFCI